MIWRPGVRSKPLNLSARVVEYKPRGALNVLVAYERMICRVQKRPVALLGTMTLCSYFFVFSSDRIEELQ